MDIDTIIARATSFYHTHTILAIVLVGAVLIYAFSRPRQTFKLLGFLLVAAGIVYAVSVFGNMVEIGGDRKSEMIYKSRDEIKE